MRFWSKFPWFSAAICLLAVLVFCGGQAWEERLILERGAPWVDFLPALWTCHLVHAGWAHLFLNLCAGAVALGWLELLSRRLAITTVLASAPVVAFVTLWASPGMARYCGLSGLIHAAAGALIALAYVRGHGRLASAALLVAFLKLLLEIAGGGSLFLGAGDSLMRSVPAAHLAGLCSGLVCGFLCAVRRTSRRA